MKHCIIVALASLIVFITALVSMKRIKDLPDMPGSDKGKLKTENALILVFSFVSLVVSVGCLAMNKPY